MGTELMNIYVKSIGQCQTCGKHDRISAFPISEESEILHLHMLQ